MVVGTRFSNQLASRQLPDLNSIGHLWNEVDFWVRMFEKKLTNKKDLWEKLQEIWYSIEDHIMRKLIITPN